MSAVPGAVIPLRERWTAAHPRVSEPPYRLFVQAHGQVQVLGWIGLFIVGMAFRLMPRFSGRPLAFPPLAWAVGIALAVALVLRLIAQAAGDGAWQPSTLLVSGALGVVAALAFAAVIGGTLLHRESRAGATGYFFVAGAAAFLAQAAFGLVLLVGATARGEVAWLPRDAAGLLHLQFYGFIMMFVLGVALRAVPTFSGLPRPERSAKVIALLLAFAVAAYVMGAELVREPDATWRSTGSRAHRSLRRA